MHDFDKKKQLILDRVALVDLVSEHVALRRAGRRWVGLCPFHSEKTPSFTVNPEMGLFKCFGCGKAGDLFSFVQLRENVSFMEAMQTLADRAGVELATPAGHDGPGIRRSDLAKLNAWAGGFFRANLRHPSVGNVAREYLRGRKINDDMAEGFALGFAGDGRPPLREVAAGAGITGATLLAADLVRQGDQGDIYDTFRNRLIFPIRDATKRIVGFGGRTLGDDRAKYLNTRQNPLFDKGRLLFGIDLARDAIVQRHRAVVVEGYTDCIAAHQAGFTETVATLGTALTEAHVDLIRRYCEEMIILFDSDEAGDAAAERAITVALPRCVRVRLARIPDGKDPCEFLDHTDGQGFSDILNGAVDALEFKWFQTLARYQGDASDARRRDAIHDFLRLVGDACLTRAVDAIQRGQLVAQVAHLLRIEQREVDRLIGGRGAPSAGHSPALVGAAETQDAVNQEQAALTSVLEVALAEPPVLGPDILVDLERISDPRDRRIAAVWVSLFHGAAAAPRVADVLARCHEPGDARRVAELAERALRRGNYAVTLRVAREILDRASQGRRLDHSTREFLEAVNRSDDGREQLAAIHDGVKARRHFAPRRMIPQPVVPRTVLEKP